MSWLQSLAVGSVSAAAIVTALKVLTGFAPFRWLWKRLVHDPVQEGLRSVVVAEVAPMLSEVRDELRPNGGASFRDAVDRLSREFVEFKDYQHVRNHDVMNQIVVAAGRVKLVDDKVDRYMAEDSAAHDRMLAELANRAEIGGQFITQFQEVLHRLDQRDEIDRLAREGRVDRRDQ